MTNGKGAIAVQSVRGVVSVSSALKSFAAFTRAVILGTAPPAGVQKRRSIVFKTEV